MNVLNEWMCDSTLRNVFYANSLSVLLSALNLDHIAVPSTQLLSELITQDIVDLEGEYALPHSNMLHHGILIMGARLCIPLTI